MTKVTVFNCSSLQLEFLIWKPAADLPNSPEGAEVKLVVAKSFTVTETGKHRTPADDPLDVYVKLGYLLGITQSM